MNLSKAEKDAMTRQYGMKAWAHMLRLDQQRGHKLNRYQVTCITAAIGEPKVPA